MIIPKLYYSILARVSKLNNHDSDFLTKFFLPFVGLGSVAGAYDFICALHML